MDANRANEKRPYKLNLVTVTVTKPEIGERCRKCGHEMDYNGSRVRANVGIIQRWIKCTNCDETGTLENQIIYTDSINISPHVDIK